MMILIYTIEKGFARETEGRPKMFKLEDLDIIEKRFQGEMRAGYMHLSLNHYSIKLKMVSQSHLKVSL